MENHADAFLQIQFRISPYLSKESLLEINHSLSTQKNESLNRSVSALVFWGRTMAVKVWLEESPLLFATQM